MTLVTSSIESIQNKGIIFYVEKNQNFQGSELFGIETTTLMGRQYEIRSYHGNGKLHQPA